MKLRLPAEWEKQDALWIVWPQRPYDWPGRFTPIRWVYADFVRVVSEYQTVKIVVDSKDIADRARTVLDKSAVNQQAVEFHIHKTDRSWIRDFGPFFVHTGKGINTVRFRFTGWAKYPQWKNDNNASRQIISKLDLENIEAEHNGAEVVLEGGSIDVNGKGTLITTRQCLLNEKQQIRNPGFTQKDYETVFKKYFGVTNAIWLSDGIAGDDTNGHVDDTCRFLNPTTVAACYEDDPADANHKALCKNLELLEDASLEDGSKLNVVKLPMPQARYIEGVRVPASYANFYICNGAVLVPTFNDPNDYTALGIIREFFSDRKVVGINSTDLIWGFGALHCMTKEQYAG